ncbi:MAG TPA: hypothetical protein EYN66_22890, partial [Myxococcales bacterium]|nr:hypothetical protein [Myxococcales bacterium]
MIREIIDISVSDGAGDPLPFKVSSYGLERTQIVATLPEDAGNKITLSYTVTRATGETGDGYQTPLEIFPPTWSLPYHQLTLSITLPKGFDANQMVIENHYSLLYPLNSKREHTDNMLTLSYTAPVAKDASPWIKLNIIFPGDGIVPKESMFSVLLRQTQIALILFVLVVVLAVILRHLHPSMSVRTTHLIHIAIGVTLVLTLGQSAFFWINATAEPPLEQWYENGLGELGAFGGFIGLVCGYMWQQSQALKEKRRDAWYGQLGVPLILTLLIGYSSVHPACYFFGLIGYAMLFYWFRSDLALFLGAGVHRLVEKVITEGETTVAALAKEFGLTEPDVVRVLKQTPELPIIADYQQGVVYSPAVAALKVEFVICKSCGGGMETGGMALLQCGYCKRSYTSTETQPPLESPTPVIVESVSHAIKGISIGLGLFAVCSAALSLLGAVVLAMATGESGWLSECLAGVYVPIFAALAAYWLSAEAKAIKTKQSNGIFIALVVLGVFCVIPPPDTNLTTSLTDWLLLTCFLVIPIMAFVGLQGPRAKIHYGAKPTALQDALKSHGEVLLSICASLLKCNY